MERILISLLPLLSKLLSGGGVLLIGAGLIFLVLAIKRSTLPYNSEGNYFDGVVNYHEHMVIFYDVLAGALFLGAVILFVVRRLFQRLQPTAPDKHHTSVEPFI